MTDIIRPNPKPLYTLATIDTSGRASLFHATEDHPWKVVEKGWVETFDLTTGDRIVTGGGEPLTVISLAYSGRNERTYNLTVAEWHTFMIGKEGAVVHNACPPLRLLHSVETLTSGSNWYDYEFWKSQATDFIVESLAPDATYPLQVDSSGLIWDGNSRVHILKERGYPVDGLPRSPK